MRKTKDSTQPEQVEPINETTQPVGTPQVISDFARQLSPNEALVLAIAQCENVAADKFNPHFKSKYFGLGDLLAEVKPIFLKYGLTILQTAYTEEGKVSVKTEVLHFSGHRFDFKEMGIKSEGLDLQKIGSVTTYLRRYSISTLAGISADTDNTDDDGNAATNKPYPQHSYIKPSRPAVNASISPAMPTKAQAKEEGKWWITIGLLSVDQIKTAEAILWKKGWLKEGELLEFLPDDKVQMLTSNPKMTQAFMEAVNNA